MRTVVAGLLGLGAVCALSSVALAFPHYPNGATALETQLLATQSADAKAFIKDEAQREAELHSVSEETPRNAARKNGSTGSDVSKVAFLILMEAARASDANVSSIVSGVQADNASKADQRQVLATNNNIAGAQQSQMSGGEQTSEKAQGHAFLSLLPTNTDKPSVAPVPQPTMNLQDAMDRQNQIEDLIAPAMQRVTQP